jgi:putative protease
MEIEVFVHGALCFANAGMCLASSYCGGMSANRGRCLQACRRRYTAGKDTGFFFSMKDLCTCDYSTRLTDAGIHSVKIEGRMKNAEYVYTVVRAYRRLLDDPAAAPEEKRLLIHDGGRAKTPLFLGGSFSPQVLQPSRPGATGTRVGRIDQATGHTCTISRPRVIPAPGDRIRIQPSGGHGGTNATVERCSRQASRIRLTLKNLSGQIRPGDTAYRTSEYHARRARTHAVIHELPRIRLTRDRRGIEQALRQYAPARSGTQDRRSRTGRILVKVDSLKWLSMLNQKHIHGCILALERTGVDRLVRNRKLLRAWKKTMGVRIPPVLYEDEYARWHRTVAACKNRGIDTFYISNLSHVALVGTDARCYWDGAVSGGMNRAALEELRQLGCTGRIVSLEDDVENMAACGAHPPVLAETIACVYGYVPVYLSRVPLPLKPGTTLKDPKGISFFTAERNGLTCVLGSKPLCLFASRDRLEHAGITTHCIDVSHIPPAARTLQTLLRAYHERQCPRGTHTFNVHHGIR